MSKTLVVEDLKRSGLTPADAKRLKITPRTAHQTELEHGFSTTSSRFPYFDKAGKTLKNYYRDRLHWASFDDAGASRPKYLQPAGSQVHAYLPPYCDWAAVADDPDQQLVITEGEKKAAKGCKSGVPTLGLGGVWSFQQKSRKQSLIPDLRAIEWRSRHVFLIFDSDLYENEQVAKALERLERMLTLEMAIVHRVLLPSVPGMVLGLDDYLVASPDPATQYELLLQQAGADVDPVQQAILEFGTDRVLVRGAAAAYDFATTQLMTRNKLRDAYAANKIVVLSAAGAPREKPISEVWWESPFQRHADRIDVMPEHPPAKVVEADDGRLVLNVFQGMGVEPKKGSTQLWQKFLRHLVPSTTEREWLERWLAYPLQHPGSKLYTTPFLWGPQGAGKSFVGSFMERIYGPSYRVLKTDMLFGSFNGWASGALFVMADDLSPDNRKQCASTLKLYIASNQIPVNAKYQPEYQIANRCQFYLNGNSPQALPLEDGQSNRRYFVSQVAEPKLPEAWYTQELHPYCQNGGAAAVYYRLLHLDLAGFDPRAHAPDTPSRHEVLASGATTVEHWCSSLAERLPKRQIMTFTELEAAYRNQTNDQRTRPGVFRTTLSRHATALGQHSALGARRSFWALQDQEAWAKSPRKAVEAWVAQKG